jgi:hypothetical protein
MPLQEGSGENTTWNKNKNKNKKRGKKRRNKIKNKRIPLNKYKNTSREIYCQG